MVGGIYAMKIESWSGWRKVCFIWHLEKIYGVVVGCVILQITVVKTERTVKKSKSFFFFKKTLKKLNSKRLFYIKKIKKKKTFQFYKNGFQN